jgi:hypothetical protein
MPTKTPQTHSAAKDASQTTASAAAAPRASATAHAPARPARRPAGRPAVKLSAKAERAAAAALPAGGAAATAGPATRVADSRAAADPRFKRAIKKLDKNAANLKKHDPAEKKAAEAQAAAQGAPKEQLAGAQAVKVEQMQATEAKKPETATFLETLRAEIERAMPKNLGETDEFMGDDKKREMKEGVSGNVAAQKETATGDIKATTQAPPDPSAIPPKEVKPLPADALPPAVTEPVGVGGAMPAPKPPEEVSLQQSKDETTQRMADANITTEQLNKANDPRFTGVVKAKQTVERHADAAPKTFRADEKKAISQSAARASADEKKRTEQMKGAHGKAGAGVKSRQQLAKEKDEARRKEVADTIEGIFNETKKAVEDKLASLETDVNTMFDRGVEVAMENMKSYINRRKDAWKWDRYLSYGPVIGGGRWLSDKLFGLPDEVKVFYEEGRKLFTEEMDVLIVRVADTVETRLKEAKAEIDKGQKRIGEYVESLPKDLQAVGKAAETELKTRFDELRQSVDDKKNDLAQGLAQRYKEARDKAEESLKAMQEEDKGLVTAFVEKLGEIIEILRKFKERVMGMLKKAEDTINLIVADPIGFLKNLLSAIKKGIGQFAANIWEHMKAGFMAWLFGSLADAGITMPKDFSLPSILQLVLDVLGINWPKIRAKIVKIVGERNMALLEAAVGLVKTLIDGGPAALWEQVKEYLGNLKSMVLDAIQEWVVTSVIKSAITKLASMFNPAGAIIQAIIAIYNTVMFFIERINQILDFVEAIINSVLKIATGAIDDAANWIEKSLARTIPLIIGFLARLLGLSGLTERIKGFILKVQSKVEQAIDKVIEKIVGGVKKLFAAGKAVAGKIFEWWKTRKQFKAADGQTHSLYFKRSGEKASLMLASEERPAKDHLNDVINGAGFDDATKAQARAALQFYQTKIEPVTVNAVPQPTPPALQALLDALPDNLTQFSQSLMQIGKGSVNDVPGTANWSFTASPKSASVELLSYKTSLGGEPARSGNPKGWSIITGGGLTTARGHWVRMHMITAAVGGRDINENLLPTPTAVNTGGTVRGFETQVERFIYGAANPREIKEKPSLFRSLNRPTVTWINVAVGGYHPAYTDPGGKLSYDAETFANSVSMKAGIHYLKNGSWVKDNTPQFKAATTVPAPDLTGAYRPNLNSIGRDTIKRLTGISGHLADEIIAERGGTPAARPHPNWTLLLSRMFAYRRSRDIPITDEFKNSIKLIGDATIDGKIKWRD